VLSAVATPASCRQGDRLGHAEGDVEVLDWEADLLLGLDQELGSAFGGGLGFQGQEDGVEFVGGFEALLAAAQAGLAVGVAGVQELAVEPLEHLAVDDLAVAEAELGDAGAVPAARRLAAFLGGR
jgi:hypothetical protein